MMPEFAIAGSSKGDKMDGNAIQYSGSKISTSLWNQKTQKVLQPDRVLGLTVTSNACFAACSSTGLLAYTAGCAIVLYHPVRGLQRHLTVPNKRVLTTISVCGKYIASGESGQVPCCRVFDTDTGNQLCELSGHKSIALVAFSPDGKYLISVGTQHDNLLIVWEWETGRKTATNKISTQVKGISFASDRSYFVTVGSRHVRYWYTSAETQQETVPLTGRSAVLGELKDEVFCDVACGAGRHSESVYVITKSGFLCRFNSQRLLEHSTLLSVTEASCLAVSEHSVLVGCANGDVLTFDPLSLEPSGSLPLPHCLGSQELISERAEDAVYPSCIALCVDEVSGHVAVVYSDHSLYVWDAQNPADVVLLSSQLFHSRCIWGLEIYAPENLRRSSLLPIGSFITCSSDDTVRIWTSPSSSGVYPEHAGTDFGNSNSRSKCSRIIYNDPKLQYLCNSDNGAPGGIDAMDCSADSKYGVRCVKVDDHGEQLAFGDRLGFVHIYNLVEMREVFKIEAHGAEVLCLDFSSEYLASAGRDRLIQIFAVDDGFNCVQTLDEHSASVTTLRFTRSSLISCGVDKKIIFWNLGSGGEPVEFKEEVKSKGGVIYDMAIDEKTQRLITANQDRQLRTYSLKTRKPEKITRGCAADVGAVIKMDFLVSKGLAATSCSDKSLSIVDVNTGECWGDLSGHSEIVTDLKFWDDGKHLLSVSGDSCVFLWKMNAEALTNNDSDREAQPSIHLPLSPSTSNGYVSDVSTMNESVEDRPVDKRPVKLNMSGMGLPSWAKKDSGKKSTPVQETAPSLPAGRWAQDIDLDRTGSSSTTSPIAFDVDHNSPKISSSKKFTSMSRSSSRPSSRPASPATSAGERNFDVHSNAYSTETPQTSILGLLGKPRRPIRDELEDEEDEAEKEKARKQTEVESSESASTFSAGTYSPPSSSRPETPLDAANRFLHLNENRIDKLIKRRVPSRSVVATKPRAVEAVVTQQPAMERTTDAETASKVAPQVSPSRKLIQNAKLAANRRRFQSTQNLSSAEDSSTIPLVFGESSPSPSTLGALRDHSTVHGMRRATSMMNINSVGFSKENPSESEGYGSLLERAKARLSAISSKRKTDTSASPCLLDLSHSGLSESPPSISAGGDNVGTEGKTFEEPSFAIKLRPPRHSSSRSRSTDRGAFASRSTSQSRNLAPDMEPSIRSSRPLSSIRLRLNSASRISVPASPMANGSPTAEAIARIKAGLGLAPKSEDDQHVVEPSSAPEDFLRYAGCVKECRDLTNAVESVMQRLTKLHSGEHPSEKKEHQVTLCTETLSKVGNRLAALSSSTPGTPELRSNGSKDHTDGSSETSSNSFKTSFSQNPVQMVI